MRLKLITSLAALTLLLTHNANSQVYVNVGLGYGAPALRELVAIDYNSTDNSDTYTGVYSSLGMGLMPQAAFGYKFNPNVGLEFGYSYLLGGKITGEINDASTPNVETGATEMWARMHEFMLGARVTASEGNLQPYMRIGMAFGVGGKVIEETETTTTGPAFNSSYHSVIEYTEGVAYGFTGGLGAHYHMSDAFGIFFEATFIAQNYSPNRSVITTLDVDGQDQLGNMTIRQKETEYVKEYTFSSPPNDGQPDQDLRFFMPMSSIGIAAGVHFYFGE